MHRIFFFLLLIFWAMIYDVHGASYEKFVNLKKGGQQHEERTARELLARKNAKKFWSNVDNCIP